MLRVSLPKMILFIVASFFLYPVLGDFIGLESRHNIKKRIVGGVPTEIYMHPWLVSIQKDHTHFCGGSIISESTILTAAHCTNKYPLDKLSVRVGSSTVSSGGSSHQVVEVKIHEKHKRIFGAFLNDVALMKVSPPFEFSESLKKTPLASEGSVVHAGSVANVAGWGYTTEKGPSSKVLESTSLYVVGNGKCAWIYGVTFFLVNWFMNSNGWICAAAPGTDTCNGDSGGPLIVDGVQVGVISSGISCADPKYPGLYTNVAVYRKWIDKYSEAMETSKEAESTS